MNVLVTGGAGFIGRWVVKRLLELGHRSVAFDDLSSGSDRNVAEFKSHPQFTLVRGSIADAVALDALWRTHGPFDVVCHLAASIQVQASIDNPRPTFQNDVVGTFELLERCRRQYFESNGIVIGVPFHLHNAESKLIKRAPRVTFMSTCMVYARAGVSGIDESHPVLPASPYAASKIAGENLALSYHLAYRLPVTVIRPFNTYGPFQKRNSEGGVVAIFISRDLAGQPLRVKGDGAQTRDLLYVEDCARFVVAAALSDKGAGEIVNAGLGRDISINDLARLVAAGGNKVAIEHIVHDHPQAEIAKLLCNNQKAAALFGWRPEVPLEEGLRRTREWLRANPDAL